MSNNEWSKSEIDRIVQGFLNGDLSETEWTHQAHLLICLHHLMSFDLHDATLRIKLGIIKYNEAIGLANTIERGYHETMTLFWVWVVDAFLADKRDVSIESNFQALIESPFSKKYLPFFFYSEDHIFNQEARVKWMTPDMRPLNSQAIMDEYPDSIWYG